MIPAALRRELGLKPGERLLARITGGALILEPKQVVERRLRERFSAVSKEISLADAVIADRRAEAASERLPD